MSKAAKFPVPVVDSIVSSSSPSAGRRKALKEADSANQELRVFESYPLAKYFDISGRLLDHFQDAVYKRRLDEAYVFGLRFANLGLCLPQHPEWKSNTNSKGVKRLTSQVEDVLCMMDVIKQRMDAEELMKIKAGTIAREEMEDQKRETEERRTQQVEMERQRERQKRNALEKEREEFYAQQRSQKKKEIEQMNNLAKKKDTFTRKKEIYQKEREKRINQEMVVNEKTELNRKKGENSTTASLSNLSPSEDKDDASTKASAALVTMKEGEKITSEHSCLLEIKQKQLLRQVNLQNMFGEKNETKTNPSSDSTSPTTQSKSISNSTAEIDSNNADMEQQFLSTTSDKKIREQYQLSQNENFLKASSYSLLPSSTEAMMGTTTTTATTTTITNSTKNSMIAAQQTPESRKEKTTIDNLQRAISLQEDRLEEIEGTQIPSLLHAAKTSLKGKNKRKALQCLGHKKRLERQTDVIKAAVFNMETQMFMLESAMEEEYVKKALDEAQAAITGYQQSIGDPKAIMIDLTNMNASLPELEVGDDTDEELMKELEEWLSPAEKKKSRERMKDFVDDEDVSLLSMPIFLQAVPMDTPTAPLEIFSTSVERVINAVMDR
eukprot:CAMPEP_0170918676 /NCGR_PEP_ID=MMETSP0735-20130129/8130_1 /TAXON_ID=186038 /ORGANISM="Fragilariopsis kerguelensis, Strain L26-C5" /LENGTH=608 /DNA_ID=CAMNT_0011317211 /DNA_START=52 /DNA_END=1879 /DNA_ORIENTATION=-